MNDVLIEVKSLVKIFKTSAEDLKVLNGLNFSLKKGEFVSIEGPSGSGKSTFLHIIGTLDKQTEGEVKILGRDISTLKDDELSILRNASVGFVFQFHHLLPELDAKENVMIPLMVSGIAFKEAEVIAEDILSKVGLSNRLTHQPSQLSGGEKQRVAVARALANKPPIILADEPTGNLDKKTGDIVLDILLDLASVYNIGVVIVTHNHSITLASKRKLNLADGVLLNAG